METYETPEVSSGFAVEPPVMTEADSDSYFVVVAGVGLDVAGDSAVEKILRFAESLASEAETEGVAPTEGSYARTIALRVRNGDGWIFEVFDGNPWFATLRLADKIEAVLKTAGARPYILLHHASRRTPPPIEMLSELATAVATLLRQASPGCYYSTKEFLSAAYYRRFDPLITKYKSDESRWSVLACSPALFRPRSDFDDKERALVARTRTYALLFALSAGMVLFGWFVVTGRASREITHWLALLNSVWIVATLVVTQRPQPEERRSLQERLFSQPWNMSLGLVALLYFERFLIVHFPSLQSSHPDACAFVGAILDVAPNIYLAQALLHLQVPSLGRSRSRFRFIMALTVCFSVAVGLYAPVTRLLSLPLSPELRGGLSLVDGMWACLLIVGLALTFRSIISERLHLQYARQEEKLRRKVRLANWSALLVSCLGLLQLFGPWSTFEENGQLTCEWGPTCLSEGIQTGLFVLAFFLRTLFIAEGSELWLKNPISHLLGARPRETEQHPVMRIAIDGRHVSPPAHAESEEGQSTHA